MNYSNHSPVSSSDPFKGSRKWPEVILRFETLHIHPSLFLAVLRFRNWARNLRLNQGRPYRWLVENTLFPNWRIEYHNQNR